MMNRRSKAIQKLSHEELSIFCEQMAMILKSGITTYEGLSMMHDDMVHSYSRNVLKMLMDKIDEGNTLSVGLLSVEVFPKYMIDMVEVGELTGRLEDVFASLGDYYQREESIRKSIKHAITYPMVMIIMMVLVIGILVIQVLPIFNSVFVQLGSELSGFSKTVMDIGTILSNSSIIILTIFVVIIILFLLLRKTPQWEKLYIKFKSNFFMTKNLTNKISSSRFANGMSLMLASGLDVDQSLNMMIKLIDDPTTKLKIINCQEKINEGEGFAEAISSVEIFNHINSRMLSIGYKTGVVDSVMHNLANRQEQEVEEQLSNLIGIIEPSLVIILSTIVGAILLSVMLPLMGIMSTIG